MFDGQTFTPEEKTFFDREENRQRPESGITGPELRSFWSRRLPATDDLSRIIGYKDRFNIAGTAEKLSFVLSKLLLSEVSDTFENAKEALDDEVERRQPMEEWLASTARSHTVKSEKSSRKR